MPRIQQHKPLTDPAIRRLSPGPRPIDVRDAGARGLILTVFPNGRRQFNVRYTFGGKHRRIVLGEYPTLTLAKARDNAAKMRTRILNGEDPAAERQAAKEKPIDTVEALALDYLAKHARKFKKTADEDERILNVDVLPRWRDRSVKSLTRRDVRALVERVADRAPIMGNHVLAVVRKMLNFAVDHEWIDANPAARVKKPSAETSRDRVLSHEEIRSLWRILSHFPTTEEKPAPNRKRAAGSEDDPLCPFSPWLAASLKARLLLAQRGGEIMRMRWADLDLDDGWWNIPGSDTKNGQPHRVPLAEDALALIKAQAPEKERSGFVFSRDGDAAAIDRAKKAPSALARLLGFEFRGHDLRRTAATGMAEAGVPREHISKVLNHIDGGPRSTAVYDRYAYDREKRIALDAWERRLRNIIAKKPMTAAVVPFARA